MRFSLLIGTVLGMTVTFKFTNVICMSYNESWFVFHNCRLKAVSRSRVFLNLNGTILHKVNMIHAHYKMFKRESGYKPWLVDKKIDCCKFLRRNDDPVYKILNSFFKPFSNLNHSCPYEGPTILKDFYLKPELLVLPLPTGDYMLSIRWFYNQRLQYDTNVSFSFVEDLRTQ
nr:uncharacterized protein LOC108063475 [Drosophila takahashii]